MRGRREGGGDTGLRFKTGEFIGTKQYNSISREIMRGRRKGVGGRYRIEV